MASLLAARTAGLSSSACSCSPRVPVAPCLRLGRHSISRCAVVAAAAETKIEVVRDVMTSGQLITVTPETGVDEALELLVRYKITGLPVVDSSRRVVGVVSDFDLLALDSLGRTNDDSDLFPVAEQTWQAFNQVKSMLAKSAGKKVRDVMTSKPLCVNPETCLNDATRILLTKKIRRLPVVDDNGCLMGVLSRGNIVKAALTQRKANAAASASN